MKIRINENLKRATSNDGYGLLVFDCGYFRPYGCKESFVYVHSSGDEVAFYDNVKERGAIKNFVHNMNIISAELKLPKFKYELFEDNAIIVQSPFWLNNKKRLDMLTCIFKQSMFWGKIEKVDDLKKQADFKKASYFPNDNLIKLLRKIREIESIFTKVCGEPFKLFTSHKKGYINGLLSFERAFSKEIEEL
jgi:hypothetical protein